LTDKTDRVSPYDIPPRSTPIQGEAYALALCEGPGLTVSRIEFIFVAAGSEHAEVVVVSCGVPAAAAAAVAAHA